MSVTQRQVIVCISNEGGEKTRKTTTPGDPSL